jgi:organic radical activating enzyme
MPQPPTLKIIEVFPSLQGEGLRQGEPTIFVRLAGCNLRCEFCDTKEAWAGGRDLGVDEVIAEIRKIRRRFPAGWVCLTGGEPYLQDLRRLVRRCQKEKLKVQVESNGRRFYPLRTDWLTLSPKPPAYSFAPEFRSGVREVKLIVTRGLNLKMVKKMRAAFPLRVPILLQPESNRRWSQKKALQVLNQALAEGLENIRLSVQLHKILGLR